MGLNFDFNFNGRSLADRLRTVSESQRIGYVRTASKSQRTGYVRTVSVDTSEKGKEKGLASIEEMIKKIKTEQRSGGGYPVPLTEEQKKRNEALNEMWRIIDSAPLSFKQNNVNRK